MTFEYRDADGDKLTVQPAIGAPYLYFRTSPSGCAVPPDRAEEVVAGVRDAARQAAGQPAAAVEETHIVADDSDDPEHVDDCPGCDDDTEPDEHCPTPETHNWGCGCATDRWPAADARSSVALHMGGSGNDPTLALLLNRYHDAIVQQTTAELRAAVGQQPTQQPATEAHPPRVQWRVSLYDPVAEEWAPGAAFSDRERALERLHAAHIHSPRWADDNTPVKRRLVRETTTWTVEDET